jgi:hypothetical protein
MSNNWFPLYNFVPIDEDLIKEASVNPLLIPLAHRYIGLGVTQVIAQSKNDTSKYFLFDVGGPSCQDYEDNREIMKRLADENSLTLVQLFGSF